MSTDRPNSESMSIEEATISSMWEIAALVELLECKGLCTKQDLYDIITEFRQKNPRASLLETLTSVWINTTFSLKRFLTVFSRHREGIEHSESSRSLIRDSSPS